MKGALHLTIHDSPDWILRSQSEASNLQSSLEFSLMGAQATPHLAAGAMSSKVSTGFAGQSEPRPQHLGQAQVRTAKKAAPRGIAAHLAGGN